MGLFHLAKNFAITLRESLDDGSDFSNPDADHRVIFLGEDGFLHAKDSAGSVTDPYDTGGSGSGQGLIDFASARRTSSDITCSADAIWADVDTGMDLTLTAASGDWVEVGVSATCLDTVSVTLFLTAMSIVSASPVNDIATGTSPSNTTNGIGAWMVLLSAIGKGAGSILYQLQAGDITGGTVVLRLRYRTSNSTNRTLKADTNTPLHFWAKNLGPSL